MEELTDGSLTLLIFDPGCYQMKKFQTAINVGSLMRLVRKDIASLKARQYQILSVQGLICDQQDHMVGLSSSLLTNFVLYKPCENYIIAGLPSAPVYAIQVLALLLPEQYLHQLLQDNT